jgi:hypothetical protein
MLLDGPTGDGEEEDSPSASYHSPHNLIITLTRPDVFTDNTLQKLVQQNVSFINTVWLVAQKVFSVFAPTLLLAYHSTCHKQEIISSNGY